MKKYSYDTGKKRNRNKAFVLFLSLIFGFFLLGGFSPKVFADEQTVNTAAELEAAVTSATSDRTIILGASFPTDISASIAIKETPYAIVIDGQGLTLQPTGISSIITIDTVTGTTATSSITIKNLNFDGLGQSARAITDNWHNGTLILENVKASNFHTAFADGGAIGLRGNTTMRNCTFSDNTATTAGYSGGAIGGKSVIGHFSFSNCKFVNNQNMAVGSGQVGGEGGAIYFYGPSATASFEFINNYFEGNKAAETINSGGKAELADGGAVALFNIVQGTNVLFEGNTFYKNIAGDDGGAVLIQTNDNITSGVLFKNNTFYQNKALGQDITSGNSGGAIQIYANGSMIQGRKAAIDYINNSFVENSAVYDGGAIGSSGYVTNNSAGRYANNLFVGNTSKTASKNNIADSSASLVIGSGDLETNIGYDNGTGSGVTVADVFGAAPVTLVNNYSGITAGTSSDAVIIPTLPIAPEKQADDKVTNLRSVDVDERDFPRTATADIGAVEIDWVKYDSNGGEFNLSALSKYDGTVYYEGEQTETYYQVGYANLDQTIPDGAAELGAVKNGYEFAGWSTDEDAAEPDALYQAGNKITTPKGNQVLYAVWKLPVVTGNVIVKHQDESGASLADDVTLSGAIGENYQTEQKTFDGYTFKEVKGNASGAFPKEPHTVIYVYTKNTEKPEKPATGTVVVKYQDESGAPLADEVTLSGNIGESFQTELKSFDGYTLKEVRGNASGTYKEEVQTAIYVYVKNEEETTPPPTSSSSTPPSSTAPSTTPPSSSSRIQTSIPKAEPTVKKTNVLPKTGETIFKFAAFGIVLIAAAVVIFLKTRKSK